MMSERGDKQELFLKSTLCYKKHSRLGVTYHHHPVAQHEELDPSCPIQYLAPPPPFLAENLVRPDIVYCKGASSFRQVNMTI